MERQGGGSERSLVERLTGREHPSLSVMGARKDRHGCRNAAQSRGQVKFLSCGGGVGGGRQNGSRYMQGFC